MVANQGFFIYYLRSESQTQSHHISIYLCRSQRHKVLRSLGGAIIATQLIVEEAIIIGSQVRYPRALKAINASTAASIIPNLYVSLPSDSGRCMGASQSLHMKVASEARIRSNSADLIVEGAIEIDCKQFCDQLKDFLPVDMTRVSELSENVLQSPVGFTR